MDSSFHREGEQDCGVERGRDDSSWASAHMTTAPSFFKLLRPGVERRNSEVIKKGEKE